jgi:hypothetical protein
MDLGALSFPQLRPPPSFLLLLPPSTTRFHTTAGVGGLTYWKACLPYPYFSISVLHGVVGGGGVTKNSVLGGGGYGEMLAKRKGGRVGKGVGKPTSRDYPRGGCRQNPGYCTADLRGAWRGLV